MMIRYNAMDAMPRYLIYLKNQDYISGQAGLLLHKARSLVSDMGVVVRDTRVATNHIEFDTSIPRDSMVDEVARRFSAISPISEYELIVEKKMYKKESILKAKEFFNEEKYWRAHEVFESEWKVASHGEKDLLNGIILVAAAFVHDEKDEKNICISILDRAIKKFSKAEGLYYDIDIDQVKKNVLQIIESRRVQRFKI
jgi:hypothetical protein